MTINEVCMLSFRVFFRGHAEYIVVNNVKNIKGIED